MSQDLSFALYVRVYEKQIFPENRLTFFWESFAEWVSKVSVFLQQNKSKRGGKMRTEIMIAIPMRVFKKKYDWLKEYPKISFNNTDFPGEYLEIPIWNADRVLHGCGINSGIILFKLKTSDSM